MGAVTRWLGRVGRTAFGYDAVKGGPHLPKIATRLQSQEKDLPQQDRDKLVTLTRDLDKNFAVSTWAINTLLDFTTDWTFHATTPNEEFNELLEDWVDTQQEPSNFDVAGRHSMRRALRMSEARRLLDGDCGWLKMQDGRVQLIEGDRIRNPKTPEEVGARDLDGWCQGLKLGDGGQTLAYAIHRRSGSQFEFERTVNAKKLLFHAHYPNRFDGVRGMTKLTPAVKTLQAIHRGIDAQMAKAILHASASMVLYRDDDLDVGLDDEEECDEDPLAEWKFDPASGPQTIQMGSHTKNKLELVESNTPAIEYQQFTKTCTLISLAALGVPYAVFDTSATNYAGIDASLTLLLKSSESGRKDVKALCNRWAAYRIGLGIIRKELDPAAFGLRFEDLSWDWVAGGVPYLSKERQTKGDQNAIDMGVQTIGQVLEERYPGRRFRRQMRRAVQEKRLLEELGLSFGAKAAASPTPPANLPTEEEEDDAEAQD